MKKCPEPFGVAFGTPPETSSTDAGSMKQLLEIGSQSQADREYDVVSESIIGQINRKAPPPEEEEPPDPKCFNDEYDFDYSGLKNYQYGSVCSDRMSISCSDRPSLDELRDDIHNADVSGEYDDLLEIGREDDLPDCCLNTH